MASSLSGSMRGGRNRKFKADINVVPYIDVMLVLLVIFMVTAPLVNPSEIALPTAGKSTQPPSEYIQITLKQDASGSLQIHGQKSGAGQPVTAGSRRDLTEKLRSMHGVHPALPVMIAADKDIKYDDVIQVISEAKKIGINRVGLATR